MFRRFGAAVAGMGAGAAAFGTGSVLADQKAVVDFGGAERQPGLSPNEFTKAPLLSRGQVTHDTVKLTFGLPSYNHDLGMEVAGLVVTRFVDADGKEVVRPYTPISDVDATGSFELLVKRYPDGKMGNYLWNRTVGEFVEFKGPFKKLSITPNKWAHIGMIAGGTGITPMYQVLTYLLKSKEDQTKLSLVYANKTPQDILLAKELRNLQRDSPRFNVYHTVTDAPASWEGGIGYINKSTLETFMPKPGAGKVLVCGPPGLMKHVSGDKDFDKSPPTQGELGGLLAEMGYSKKDVYKF